MYRPPENVSNYPEISLLKRRFTCFCADLTTKPTASNAMTGELNLNKRESKELIELYYKDVLSILNDDDQIKPSFSNFDLLDGSQRSGCNPKIGEPITARRELSFCQNQ
jgi:integration host factor subunit alpha